MAAQTQSRRPRVMALEFNEITWDLMDPLMAKGLLPNFQALAREGVRAAPWADEEDGHLDPWITWTTLYTGVPQAQHGLSMLEQDGGTLGARRLWEYLSAAGLRLGLFGSANTWPPKPVDGYWVPGPFSRDFQTYPKDLEPIQALNVGLTRGHTTGSEGSEDAPPGGAAPIARPSMKKLIPQLLSMGLSIPTCVRMAMELGQIKLKPETRWKMVALQPVLNLDLFGALYRKHQPDFATFHSNHVAYYMHRFWRAMDPSAFDVPPSEEEQRVYGGAVEHGYRIADEVLGKVRRLIGPDVNLVVLSSCGQQPATGGRYSTDQREGNVGLQIRIRTLLELLELTDKTRFSNLMAPQWKVDFDDPETLRSAVDRLTNAKNITRNAPVFAAQVVEQSICLGAHRNQQMDDTLELSLPSGTRRFRAGELLERHAEVVKSGKHHPKGVLLMHGPDVKRGVNIDGTNNLDIAPTLLRLLGQPVPEVMPGRVLEEALANGRAAAPARELAAV